jgi:uncharacterized membrane protein
MRRLVLLLSLVLLLATVTAREPRRDPASGRIRVLYIGDAWGPTPYFHMTAEPSFIGTPIPATYQHMGTYGDRELRQFMRIYMPRNYRDLTSNYDILILSDTNRALYAVEQLEWFRRGVEETGIGMMMVGGVEAFGGDGHPSWGSSSVEDALPVLCISDTSFRNDFKVVANHPDDPFLQSLPWGTMPAFHGMNVVTAKEGSTVLLQANVDANHPALAYWEYGEGSSLAHMPDWTPAWGSSVMYYWEYYSDYIANMNYLVAGVQIPQNPQMMHQIRAQFRDYVLNRALAVSLMEFVEKFGARISVGEERLTEIAVTHGKAVDHYINQEYDQALGILVDMDQAFKDLSDELVELKDRALFWIYIVEWLAVSGTAIICGALVWALMVRRRLYREVRITRARA